MELITEGKSGRISWSFSKLTSKEDEARAFKHLKLKPNFWGRVEIVTENVPGIVNADGLLTKGKISVAMKTADCIPVVAIWPDNSVAILHLHFRGLFFGLVDDFKRKVKSLDLSLEECRLMFGPSICVKCYSHENLIRRIKWLLLRKKFPKQTFVEGGRHLFDIKKAYYQEFVKAGIRKGNIVALSRDYCTGCALGVSRHHGVRGKSIITSVTKG